MRLTAAEIAARARRRASSSATPDAVVTSWAFDSRALDAGACFVALTGDRDGHDFVADAFRAGAHVALVDATVPRVDAARRARARAACADVLAGLQAVAAVGARAIGASCACVGVAGSTGKTSTKDLLAAALAAGASRTRARSRTTTSSGCPITLLNTPRRRARSS